MPALLDISVPVDLSQSRVLLGHSTMRDVFQTNHSVYPAREDDTAMVLAHLMALLLPVLPGSFALEAPVLQHLRIHLWGLSVQRVSFVLLEASLPSAVLLERINPMKDKEAVYHAEQAKCVYIIICQLLNPVRLVTIVQMEHVYHVLLGHMAMALDYRLLTFVMTVLQGLTARTQLKQLLQAHVQLDGTVPEGRLMQHPWPFQSIPKMAPAPQDTTVYRGQKHP